MLFEEGDAALLKKWIVKRLEDMYVSFPSRVRYKLLPASNELTFRFVLLSSDADSDVLADYVLALLRHEQGEEEVKSLCVEQLDDFLRERMFRDFPIFSLSWPRLFSSQAVTFQLTTRQHRHQKLC